MTDRPVASASHHYRVNICKADDADRIIAATFKNRRTPLLSGNDAAGMINSGIRAALGRATLSQESPPSEQAEWTGKLVAASEKALALLSPSATAVEPPSHDDLLDNIGRLFNASGGPPPEIEAILKQRDLQNPGKTIDAAIFGVWLMYAVAKHADTAWRGRFRPRSSRRLPNQIELGWLTGMGAIYKHIFGEPLPKAPDDESPFVRFCDGVRLLVLEHQALMSEGEVTRQFLAMLRGAAKKQVAKFISDNKTWNPPRQ
jgi:hypothetical protein